MFNKLLQLQWDGGQSQLTPNYLEVVPYPGQASHGKLNASGDLYLAFAYLFEEDAIPAIDKLEFMPDDMHTNLAKYTEAPENVPCTHFDDGTDKRLQAVFCHLEGKLVR